MLNILVKKGFGIMLEEKDIDIGLFDLFQSIHIKINQC